MPYTVDELRAQIAEREAKHAEITEGVRSIDEPIEIDGVKVDGGVYIPKGVSEAAEANAAELKELQGLLQAELQVEGVKRWAEGDNVMSAAEAAAAAAVNAQVQAAADATKSLGAHFTGSEEFKAFMESGQDSMGKPWTANGSLLGVKNVHTGSVSGTTTRGFGRMERDPMVPAGQRGIRVRDLFPARPTAANLIEFFRTTGYTNDVVSGDTNAASMVPEYSSGFVSKPQTSLTFSSEASPVRTIAHWEMVHRHALADEPQLQGIINDELLYGLRLREDDQILNGAGTSEDLTGLMVDAGVQTYASPANELRTDAIRVAMTKVMLAYWEPTGLILHPNDWEAIELAKVGTGDDRYLYVASVSEGASPVLWRLPVAATPAMTAGTALVGAFGIGAQLYDREQGNVRIAEQHGNTFIQNAITVLAEQRVALAIKRPEAFCKVTALGS